MHGGNHRVPHPEAKWPDHGDWVYLSHVCPACSPSTVYSLLYRAHWDYSSHGGWTQEKVLREHRGSCVASEVPFPHLLLVKVLTCHQIQRPPPLARRGSANLWSCFKTIAASISRKLDSFLLNYFWLFYHFSSMSPISYSGNTDMVQNWKVIAFWSEVFCWVALLTHAQGGSHVPSVTLAFSISAFCSLPRYPHDSCWDPPTRGV